LPEASFVYGHSIKKAGATAVIFMSNKLSIALVLIAVFFAIPSISQSRRQPQQPNQRVNQRPAAPSPTPTPTPDEAVTEDPTATDSGETIAVDTRLVTMPVRVLDRKNRFIGGLERQNFTVLENNVEQRIEHFQNEEQPFTVALVLDMSYSTLFKIDDIQAAAIAFIDQLKPNDKVTVISFAEEIHVHCPATSDRKEIYRAIQQTKISTGTSLYDTMDLLMNKTLRAIEGRKAIVLFSDGVDTTSRTSHDLGNLRDAMEIDVLIYPIRYDTFADVQALKDKPIVNRPDNTTMRTPPTVPTSGQKGGLPFPIPGPMVMTPGDKGTTVEEYAHAEEYLNKMADRTGGRIFLASTLGNLSSAFRTIASELREFYSIGYYPTEDGKPGQTRRIKVKVDRENVAVKTRNTYVVPESKVERNK
jgi:VWFA-related protein